MAIISETPSRIWRRIQDGEERDMPSLPSLPAFEDSAMVDPDTSSHHDDESSDNLSSISTPITSTPAPTNSHHTASTIYGHSATASATRFANSIRSSNRSSRSSLAGFMSSKSISRLPPQHESFDVSAIPSLPAPDVSDEELDESQDSVPNAYLPPQDTQHEDEYDDLSITDALRSVSRSGSPSFSARDYRDEATPKKKFSESYVEYSVSLRSEPKPSPFKNISHRRPPSRMRTPSLSRTSSTGASSPTQSTPRSHRSSRNARSPEESPVPAAAIPLPPSNNASPAIEREYEDARSSQEPSLHESDSMEMTGIHQSPGQPVSDQEEVDASQQSHEDQPSGTQHSRNSQDSHSRISQDSREPTFSSEEEHGEDTQREISPSLTYTPTPAFPRPRARFDLPPPPNNLLTTPKPPQSNFLSTPKPTQQESEDEENQATPYSRRKSFLLDVINSTARPRMRTKGTPYRAAVPETPGNDTTVSNMPGTLPRTNLQVAFAGVTPRFSKAPVAGRRMSHPLAQTFVPSPSSGGDSATGSDSEGHVMTDSEGQAMNDGASFISTASSHDLIHNPRANLSFDPAMGLHSAAEGHAVNRFNAGKLNNYLHGLNRRLQEENEALVARLTRLEEERRASGEASDPAASSALRRLSGGSGSDRRTSAGSSRRISTGSTLSGVREDPGAEGWMEEKAELEEIIDTYKAEREQALDEKAQALEEKAKAEQALSEERAERARDKDKWRDRMSEVEKGVEAIVTDLENKARAAEARLKDTEARLKDTEAEHKRATKELERKVLQVENERDDALDRAAKAESRFEDDKDLGGELREVNAHLGQVSAELRNAKMQIKQLEDEVLLSQDKIDDLEKQLEEEKNVNEELENDLHAREQELAKERNTTEDVREELEKAQTNLRTAQNELRQTQNELQVTKEFVAELEDSAAAASERIEALEHDLAEAENHIRALEVDQDAANDHIDQLENDAQRTAGMAQQTEEALDAAEQKMQEDDEEIAQLKAKVASLERELERARDASMMNRSTPHDPTVDRPTDEEVEALENELDEANKEIARLTTLLEQSPARKAIEKAKDTRIEMLEKEKEELLERNRALRMTVNEMNSPSKMVNHSGISPIARHAINMSMRMPKTPGTPLRDMSWLNSTRADSTHAPLVAEIERLQKELDRANDSIDDKLDKLEDAGLGVVGLTKKLEEARGRIRTLESELSRLSRQEERRVKRLQRLRCQKCKVKVDVSHVNANESTFDLGVSQSSLPSEPPTPPTKTTNALRSDVRQLNEELARTKRSWDDERRRLTNEKNALQDAANRLNAQIREEADRAAAEARKAAQEAMKAANGERARTGMQGELDQAKLTIAELEGSLKAERARLRSLMTEQSRAERERDSVVSQLQRTEEDMEDVRQQLNRFKKENHDLERELRANANAEQKTRLLEARVSENAATIEQLRQERSMLAADHKELQKRFAETSERASRLHDQYLKSQTSHDGRRHQLDLHLLEIEDLRRALSDQADELHRAEAERHRIEAERSDVAKTVGVLEADLKRVRRDAEAFGRDLQALRGEKEKLEAKRREDERARKQAQAQIRLLTEQVERHKESARKARMELEGRAGEIDEIQVQAIEMRHKEECKGLLVQIRYLKAKFTRESTLRGELAHQKRYLLVLLGKFEKSERTIISAIAQIGFTDAPPEEVKRPRVQSVKSAALAVIFLARARRASEGWRKQRAMKTAIQEAYQEARRSSARQGQKLS
ncbi:hypothetical protein GGG16DRAFT_88498 [Schizophyllum commune]